MPDVLDDDAVVELARVMFIVADALAKESEDPQDKEDMTSEWRSQKQKYIKEARRIIRTLDRRANFKLVPK